MQRTRRSGTFVSPAASSDLSSVVAALQAEVTQQRLESAATIAELRQTLATLREENQMLLRRLYGNKTERLKTAETQLAFADLLDDKQALQRELNALIDEAAKAAASEDGTEPPEKKKRNGGGVASSVRACCLAGRWKFPICHEHYLYASQLGRRLASGAAATWRQRTAAGTSRLTHR